MTIGLPWEKKLGEFLALTALLLYSCNTLGAKYASKRVSMNIGYTVAVTVNVLFSGLLVLFNLATRESPLVWNWAGFFYFAAAGGFSTFLGRWLYFESVFRFGPARASIYQLGVPLFTTLIAWLLLGERLNGPTLAGIFVTVFGLFLAVYVPGSLSANSQDNSSLRTSHAARVKAFKWLLQTSGFMGVGGALAYAIGNIWRGAAMHIWNEPLLGALCGAAAGMLAYIVFTPGVRAVPRQLRSADRIGIAIFCTTGLMNISAQIMGIMSLRYLPVSIAALITSCVPVLVIPGSYFLFKNQEGIGLRTVAGTALTIGGIALILLYRGA